MSATEALNQITVLYDDEKQKNHLVESFTSSSFTGHLKFTPYSSYPHDVYMSTHQPQHPQHPFSPTLYLKNLTTEKLGRICCYSQRVTSTQTILNEQLTHAPVGTVVIADHQVTGKGRGGNIWTSPAGCLMFSVKFQTYQAILLPFVQYLASLNMVRAINPYVDIRIKWPNDLYTPEGIKLGGMLCQSSYMDRVFDIVCGIGINVANETPTTCLNTLYKKKHGEDVEIPFSRESILSSFMNHFEKDLVIFEKQGFDPFRQDYLKYWLHTNQRVTLGGDKREVIITGIAPSGFLQACDVNDSTKQMELHPDGNSLDFLQGLLVQKEWKTEKPHECDNCK